MGGWIKLHRQFREHPFWKENRVYSRAEAWIDLIYSANHADAKIMLDGKVTLIKRGQFHTSELKLAERWNWNRKKVRLFLDLLRKENMIASEGTTRGTTVTLVNYDFFQGEGPTDGTTEGTTLGTTEGQLVGHKQEEQEEQEPKNDEEDNNALTQQERDALAYLKTIANYPFDYETDLRQLREWLTDFPSKDILAELKSWAAWLRDNQKKLNGRVNYRSRFTNWLKPKKWEKCGEEKQYGTSLSGRSDARGDFEKDYFGHYG